jgi:hypothetical protein
MPRKLAQLVGPEKRDLGPGGRVVSGRCRFDGSDGGAFRIAWTERRSPGSGAGAKKGRNPMLAKGALGLAVVLAACCDVASLAKAETLLEQSAEVRMQLDLAVTPAALKALLPDGWEPFVATSGAAKDCNIRMIFVDRVDINGPDGAPAGTEQFVYLASPIKKTSSSEMAGQMVVDGVTADPKDAPGPFGVYQAATSYRVERSTHAVAGQPIQNEENWEFAAANGEQMELHLTYERGVARKIGANVKFFSAANPDTYQIWKIEQGLDVMRNATVPVKDKVKQLEVKATGGKVGTLFDGAQRVVSVDAFHWYNRGVYQP